MVSLSSGVADRIGRLDSENAVSDVASGAVAVASIRTVAVPSPSPVTFSHWVVDEFPGTLTVTGSMPSASAILTLTGPSTTFVRWILSGSFVVLKTLTGTRNWSFGAAQRGHVVSTSNGDVTVTRCSIEPYRSP